MDRKTFIKKTAGAILVVIPAYSILGCSSSDDGGGNPNPDPNTTANCLANGTAISIGTNHGHSLTVSKADVEAGTEKTYSIQGTSSHAHSVTLSAANFTALKSNTAISVTSTNGDSHTHSVSVSCA
ncbi:MAG: hypothetical protein WBM53_09035 [Maribacter sp.]